MDLTVLAVPDCPNVMLLEQRLAQVTEGRRDVTVSRQVIADEDEAARWGMHGSPTLLVDGSDPFTEPGEPASLSCRLYRDGNGQADGAPSVSQLRQAIGAATDAAADTDTPDWLDAAGRGGRGRIAPAERGLRAVHQAVLRSFAATGRAPEQGGLVEAARPIDARQVLAELAEGDFLCLDQAGRISAAYPFSATATPHTVQITGGTSAYAMCAIDALGMAAMLQTSVLITSADPFNGEPVTVALDGTSTVWNPATTVVFVGRTADQCAGPSAAICCDHINFFTTHSTAEAWASAHPEITGGILSHARALEVAEQIFGQLLRLPRLCLVHLRWTVVHLRWTAETVRGGWHDGPDEAPLHYAASSDDVDVAQALIEGGADIEAPGGSIGTPLDNAVGYACWHVARLLVARGARVDKAWHAAALGMLGRLAAILGSDPPAETVSQAFWHACAGGQRRAAEYLLSRGADLNWEPDYAHGTPLDTAGGMGTRQENVISWLRELGARCSNSE